MDLPTILFIVVFVGFVGDFFHRMARYEFEGRAPLDVNVRSHMRYVVAFVLALWGAACMAQGFFIHSRSAASGRLAILEDDARVAYLYLTKPGTQQPEKDAIVYTRVAPVDRIDWEAIRKSGEPPPLPKDVASATAVLVKPAEREFSFRWSRDGNAVAVLRNGQPIAFAAMSERFGYSRAVSKNSPLANPWDQAKYDSLFKR